MNLLFEWNWLGYLWAIFVGFSLFLIALMFVGEVVSMSRTGSGQQGATLAISIYSGGVIMFSFILGIISILVWDWHTAAWLAGGSVGLLVLVFTISYVALRLAALQGMWK